VPRHSVCIAELAVRPIQTRARTGKEAFYANVASRTQWKGRGDAAPPQSLSQLVKYAMLPETASYVDRTSGPMFAIAAGGVMLNVRMPAPHSPTI
jgi:hypothetical protein